MKEVKTPKKPLIFYYAVAMLAVFLFNFFAMPWLAQHQIKESCKQKSIAEMKKVPQNLHS